MAVELLGGCDMIHRSLDDRATASRVPVPGSVTKEWKTVRYRF